MKHNLGNVLLFLISFTLLNAGDFDYSLHTDKTTPYVKEAVILTIDVNQTNHDIVLFFDFDLVKSESYSFQRIDIKETDAYHAVQIQYTYLVYPLHSGDVDIHFNLTQKATTDESVAYSFSGDRDNIKTLETTNTNISLPPLRLAVKALPNGTQVVGDFQLDYKVNKLRAYAFEPLPLHVTIQGTGYTPLLNTLIPTHTNFTRFTEKALVTSVSDIKGTYNNVIYPMALSHDKNFTLDTIVIQAFNPEENKSYVLSVPAQDFKIQQIDTNTLIDKINTPEQFQADWSWIKDLLTYLVIFMAGYLTALSLKWKKKIIHQAAHPLTEKIKQSKTHKELLRVLMSDERKQFTSCIEKLEASLYSDTEIKLNTIKKEALEKLL